MTRFLAWETAAYKIRHERNQTVTTRIRAGKFDFYLLVKQKDDNTPWNLIKPTEIIIDSEAMFEFGTLSPDDIVKLKNIENDNIQKRNVIKAKNGQYKNPSTFNRFDILSEQELLEDNANEANDICREVIEIDEEMNNEMILENHFVPLGQEHPSLIINNIETIESSLSKRNRVGSRTSSPEHTKFAKKDESPFA